MTGSIISVTRYHDISCGHRVVGHEGKCVGLHGHNYRIYFTCIAEKELDSIGRVIDFSVIKSHLCEWLENSWDHRMLLWEEDPLNHLFLNVFPSASSDAAEIAAINHLFSSVVSVSFNPTAENMAAYLLHKVGPMLLHGTGAKLVRVKIDETRKCSAEAVSTEVCPVVYDDQLDWTKAKSSWDANKRPSSGYLCTGGHDRCDQMLPGPECQYCERRDNLIQDDSDE